ncbi:hypothetical protein CSPX01_00659 [Colletotrichum filicis]|nr:hypothetical protein CSPX01_00659 [Colletotrichum filicis]
MSTYAAKGQCDYPPQVELCWLYAAANDDVHAEALLACQGVGCTIATEGIPILWGIDRVPSSEHLTMILEALVRYLPQEKNKDLASQYSAAARHHSDPEAVDLASWKNWVARKQNNTHDIIEGDIFALRRQIKAFLDWCQRSEGKSLNDSECKGGSSVS